MGGKLGCWNSRRENGILGGKGGNEEVSLS
jgi:hypothetical protein